MSSSLIARIVGMMFLSADIYHVSSNNDHHLRNPCRFRTRRNADRYHIDTEGIEFADRVMIEVATDAERYTETLFAMSQYQASVAPLLERTTITPGLVNDVLPDVPPIHSCAKCIHVNSMLANLYGMVARLASITHVTVGEHSGASESMRPVSAKLLQYLCQLGRAAVARNVELPEVTIWTLSAETRDQLHYVRRGDCVARNIAVLKRTHRLLVYMSHMLTMASLAE